MKTEKQYSKNPVGTEVIMGFFSLCLERFFTCQMAEIQSTNPANNCKNETCRYC